MPTAFGDFGAKANGLFTDNHNQGEYSITTSGKIASSDEAGYTLNLKNACGEKPVTWSIESNLKNCKVTLDHENNISKEINLSGLHDKMSGLGLTWKPIFNLKSGINWGTLTTNYSNDKINLNLTTGLSAAPSIDFDVSAVAGSCPVNYGFKGSLNSSFGLENAQLGIHKDVGGLELSFITDDIANPLNGTFSVYKTLEGNKTFCCYGVQKTGDGILAIAAASQCCKNQTSYKLDQTGLFSIAKSHKLNCNATLNLSASTNLANLGAGHKFGVGFSFE